MVFWVLFRPLEQYYREQRFLPGRDKVGYAGIEASMQDELAGRNGKNTVEIDVAGQEMRNIAEPKIQYQEQTSD